MIDKERINSQLLLLHVKRQLPLLILGVDQQLTQRVSTVNLHM